jgi:2-oxoisovalerate dehydrogenase E2 component (dihydrolipoyl transacylase)
MGLKVITVPDLGEGIAEVELVAWHVKVGDVVGEDQSLADVLSDKATVEIPSSVAGRVEALGGEVGQVLAVGAELIRIAADEGDAQAAAIPSPPASTSPPVADPSPSSAAAASSAPPAPAAHPRSATPAAPHTRSPAAAGSSRAPAQQRPIASPAVRARAWQLGIDLAQVSASGTAGRITQADLDACVARGMGSSGPPPTAAAPVPPRATSAPGETHTVKLVGLRRKIAQKMQESKRRIPHFSYVEEVDVSELETLRTHLNRQWQGQRSRLTVLPFLIRAIVLAVREFPEVNARFDDEAGVLTRHGSVHVGIATQTDAGLMVPVLRDAERHDLWANAAEVARLAEAARSGTVVRDELMGSTITITSLGRLGGIVTTPVINHPEVAIVGVNRMVERPMLRSGAIVARQMMNLSSSFDHRVVDGSQAAAFVQSLRGHLEHPATLFIE